jgi:hypothetical protein
LETKQKTVLANTKKWKAKMIEALGISMSDMDGKFDFSDAGRDLLESIQAYLDDPNNKIRVSIDAKDIAEQLKAHIVNLIEHLCDARTKCEVGTNAMRKVIALGHGKQVSVLDLNIHNNFLLL